MAIVSKPLVELYGFDDRLLGQHHHQLLRRYHSLGCGPTRLAAFIEQPEGRLRFVIFRGFLYHPRAVGKRHQVDIGRCSGTGSNEFCRLGQCPYMRAECGNGQSGDQDAGQCVAQGGNSRSGWNGITVYLARMRTGTALTWWLTQLDWPTRPWILQEQLLSSWQSTP